MTLKTLFVISLICLVACANGMPEVEWNPTLYATDSKTRSIVREADDGSIEQIFSNEREFDGKICMDQAEPRKAQEICYQAMLKCEKWK